MDQVLYPAAGALLLGLLAFDIFQTAFHAEGRGGPVNRRQNRWIWNLVRRIGTAGGATRPKVLSLGGPLMAVTTIGVWSFLLIAGFALIYLPHVLDFHFSPGQPGSALLEAFYYSAIIAGTLGQGDVVAPGTALRIITIVEGLAGFAMVTVAVSYVLAIYRELITVQTLAAALHARLGDPDDRDGPPIPTHDPDWDRSITLRLAHVLEAHFNYPILHYFRPSRQSRSLPPQLSRLLLAGRSFEEQAAGSDLGTSHRALGNMIERYVSEVHTLFVRQEPDPDEDTDAERARLRQIVSMMAYEDPTGST